MSDGHAARAESSDVQPEPKRSWISRRRLLQGGIGVGIGAAGVALGASMQQPSSKSSQSVPVDAHGEYQAGVTRPSTPQRNALITVADVDLASLPQALQEAGDQILALTGSDATQTLPDGAGDLTVLIGLGARALASFDPDLAALVEMPLFKGDEELDPALLGGDLLISVNASDPGVLEPVRTKLASLFPGFKPRWSEYGFRGPGEEGVARNPFGFHDGVQVPRTPEELDAGVWISEGPLARGTICVMRRFDLDVPRFGALSRDDQEAVMGRDKITGAPLSGGELLDVVDLTAKHENGDFVLPNGAHARVAHPSFIGAELMLRRSYNTIRGGSGKDATHGHVFTAFQKEVRTFVLTQQRMDESDDLTAFITPTATSAFAILPGYDATHPLGSTL